MKRALILTVAIFFYLAATSESAIPDLLVGSSESDSILRYDGVTGAFLGEFASGAGLDRPLGFTIGPDANLYVSGMRIGTGPHAGLLL